MAKYVSYLKDKGGVNYEVKDKFSREQIASHSKTINSISNSVINMSTSVGKNGRDIADLQEQFAMAGIGNVTWANMYEQEIVLFPEAQIALVDGSLIEMEGVWVCENVPITLEVNKSYTVVLNGLEYNVTAKDIGDYGIVIGNIGFLGGDDTGEPFLIFNQASGLFLNNAVILKITTVSNVPVAHEYLPDAMEFHVEGHSFPIGAWNPPTENSYWLVNFRFPEGRKRMFVFVTIPIKKPTNDGSYNCQGVCVAERINTDITSIKGQVCGIPQDGSGVPAFSIVLTASDTETGVKLSSVYVDNIVSLA